MVAATWAGPALAQSRPDFRMAQLSWGPNALPRPSALRRLAWEIRQRTSIEADPEPVTLAPDAPELFAHPFLYLSGQGALPELPRPAMARLRRYLTFGGTLLVDNAEGTVGGAFDRSVRAAIARLLPSASLDRVPRSHVMYKSYYLVDRQSGRTLASPDLWGVALGGRMAVIYSMNDLGGAWDRDDFGRWRFDVRPGGERQREMSFRLGVNIAMYALCLDYKDDLVHLPFIMKRRRN